MKKTGLLFLMSCLYLLVGQSVYANPTFKLPFEGDNWKVTRGYGVEPTHVGKDFYALDFAKSPCADTWRQPILAAADGIVESAQNSTSYGLNVIIDHGGGFVSRYAHLESISVSEGEWVYQGTEIGKCGNTGNANGVCPEHPGTHLHFAVYKDWGAYKPEPMDDYTGFSGIESYDSSNTCNQLDQNCRNASPDPRVERFRDKATGRIVVSYSPADGRVYYYGAGCSVKFFELRTGASGTGGGGQGGGTSPSPSSSKPDLYIRWVKIADDSDGDHPKESYYPIEKFYIIVEVANAGVEPTRDVVIGFYLYESDGSRKKIGEAKIKHEHLKKGMTHVERIDVSNIDPGTRDVKVRVDNEKEISESDENNNWSTPVKLVIKAWPNFIINEIIVDGATSFITGTTLSVRGKFWNKGGDTKDGISVASYLVDSAGNSVLVATQTIKDYHLEENEYHWEGMTFTLPSTPGNYSLKLVADYNGLVKESNEGDNSMTIPIVVVAASTTITTSTTTTSSTTSTTTTTSTSTSTTTTATFSSTTSTTTTKNLLSFPYFEDFENGAGGFFLKDRTSAKEAVLVVLEGEGVNGSDCLAVLNQNPPGDSWDVQTGIAGLDFKEGEYKLSFSLKSDTSGVFGIEFSDSVSPSQVFFYDETNLLLGWGDYSWSFWATDFSGVNPADIQLAFDFGGATGSFYLDNVRLEILYESPDDKPVVSTAPASSASGESKKEGGGGCFIGTLFK